MMLCEKVFYGLIVSVVGTVWALLIILLALGVIWFVNHIV